MAKGIQWRKLVNVQDIGDIVALVMSARKLLERRGEQAPAQGFEPRHRGHRVTRRWRALYQFMKIDTARLKVK